MYLVHICETNNCVNARRSNFNFPTFFISCKRNFEPVLGWLKTIMASTSSAILYLRAWLCQRTLPFLALSIYHGGCLHYIAGVNLALPTEVITYSWHQSHFSAFPNTKNVFPHGKRLAAIRSAGSMLKTKRVVLQANLVYMVVCFSRKSETGIST